jgi:hypothetical protein
MEVAGIGVFAGTHPSCALWRAPVQPSSMHFVLFPLRPAYRIVEDMASQPPRSAGVTAAATYAILCCVTSLFVWGFLVLQLLNWQDDEGRTFFDYFPVSFVLVAVIPPAIIALGIRTSVGLLQLRPWARRASLIWAATALTLCLGLIGFRPFETFVIPQHFVSETVLTRQMVAISFVLMLMPASVWWLFYFRAKRVKLQFLSADSAAAPATEPATAQN